MTPSILHFIDKFDGDPSEFHLFDFGDQGDSGDIVENTLFDQPIPFDKIAVVFLLDGRFQEILAERSGEGFAFCRNQSALTNLLWTNGDHFVLREIFSRFLKSIERGATFVKPYRDEAKNRRRVAKGKKPLRYEWKTVVIKPKAAAPTALGGTHASPRRHERRGHWRNLKSGKRVWVRNCWAGNATLGTVFKDYVVKGDNR